MDMSQVTDELSRAPDTHTQTNKGGDKRKDRVENKETLGKPGVTGGAWDLLSLKKSPELSFKTNIQDDEFSHSDMLRKLNFSP